MAQNAQHTHSPLTPAQKWEQATLANNFIFYKVMRHHRNACKTLLELLLDIKIRQLHFAQEETVAIDSNAKSIRLDVLAEDAKRMFDIELQVADTKELSERARYYQGVLDVDTLGKGQRYRELKEAHIIFLCMEDIFGEGLPVYTFENTCREKSAIKLNDRAYKHFFIAPSCATLSADSEQRAFFQLLTTGSATSAFTEQLKAYVDDAKHNTQWRVQYMTWERQRTYDFDAGMEKGQAIGINIGMERGQAIGMEKGARQEKETLIRQLFAMQLGTPEQIAQAVQLPLETVLALTQ